MKRLRFLGGFLGCLAVLSAGLPMFALAGTPAHTSEPAQLIAADPCNNCEECDGAPCATGVMACVQVCLGLPSVLGVSTTALPAIQTGMAAWVTDSVALHGRSVGPDPLPPRL